MRERDGVRAAHPAPSVRHKVWGGFEQGRGLVLLILPRCSGLYAQNGLKEHRVSREAVTMAQAGDDRGLHQRTVWR